MIHRGTAMRPNMTANLRMRELPATVGIARAAAGSNNLPDRPAEIVDVSRWLGRKQACRRRPVEAALAFRLVLAIGAVPLPGEGIVHAVDDQHGVIALQRIGGLALLVGA